VLYTWIGYPLLLWLIAKLARKQSRQQPRTSKRPRVSLVIAVHNGGFYLERKIENCLSLEYPRENLEIIVASDGSTDETDTIAQRYSDRGISLYRSPQWIGKTAVQNLVIPAAAGEVIVLTDVATSLSPEFLVHISAPFEDSQVGCVVGELSWRKSGTTGLSHQTSAYWRYETFVRRLESTLGILCQASGQCMAFRKDLFRDMPPFVGDDGIIPRDVCVQGYKVVHTPDALAWDEASPSLRRELRNRARMTQRNLMATFVRLQLLNPVAHPLLAWSLVSHKLLRWLTPYTSFLAILAGVFLLPSLLYLILYSVGSFLFLVALVGLITPSLRDRAKPVAWLTSLLVVNVGLAIGVYRGLTWRRMSRYMPTQP